MTDSLVRKSVVRFTHEGGDEWGEPIHHFLGTENIIVSMWDENGVHVLPLHMRTQDENMVTVEIGSNIARARFNLPEVSEGTEIEVTVIG